VESGKRVEIYIELTPDAAKEFGSGELTLTKGGKTVVETLVALAKDDKGKGTLKIALDREAVDGGELLIWSGHIKDAPPVKNFGGFRLSIADLLAGEDEDRAEAVMKAMDGFRTKLPEAVWVERDERPRRQGHRREGLPGQPPQTASPPGWA